MNAQPSELLSAGASSVTRVLIIDSHTIVREGVSVLLSLEEDLTVIGHAASVADCIRDAALLSPDLIITEIDVGGVSDVEDLRRGFPAAVVLVLSLLESEEAIRAALAAGAHGYVLKESGRKELLAAIRAVLGGTRSLCERASGRVVSRFLDSGTSTPEPAVATPLTRSEREILSMVARGMSNKHVARVRGRSVRTIEKQRAMLMRKLGLRNAAGLTRFAIANGVIEPGHMAHSEQTADA